MQQELLQKLPIKTIGGHIGYEAGEEMVKRFYDKHPEQQYGNIAGREVIEQILAQPDCAGIIILPAYNDKGIRQTVIVGVDSQRQPILNFNIVNVAGQILSEQGIVADGFEKGWGGCE